MQSADDAVVAEVFAPADEDTSVLRRSPTATPPGTASVPQPRRAPRWIFPALAAQFCVVGVVGASAYALRRELHLLSQHASSTSHELQTWAAKTSSLQDETSSLKSEIQNLRQYIASSSNEDVIFLKATILKPDIEPELARIIARNVHRYAQLYGRDANLVLAMIAVESKFNPKAVSSVGALGLMQVMPQWKKVLAINGDLTDPEINVKYGLQILGFYSEMYKDLEVALTAYNRGPGPVDMALMRGKDPKNGYAPRVLQTYDRLKKLSVASAPAEL